MAKYTLEDLDKVFSEPIGFDHPYVTAMNKMRDFLGDDRRHFSPRQRRMVALKLNLTDEEREAVLEVHNDLGKITSATDTE